MHLFPADQSPSQRLVQERYKIHGRTYPACFEHDSTSSDGKALVIVNVSILCRAPRPTACNLFFLELYARMSGRLVLAVGKILREIDPLRRMTALFPFPEYEGHIPVIRNFRG